MRRFATLCLALVLGGCGYNTWWNPPFTTGNLPYAPQGASENLMRAEGTAPAVAPLTPQPGDVWPGQLQSTPTLQDLEREGNLEPGVEQPVPGSPLNRGGAPSQGTELPALPPQVTPGSSTPPSLNQPGLAPLPPQQPISPQAPSVAMPEPPRPGQVVPLERGQGVTTGGSSGYQTLTTPGGGSAIVVPNGNGTSTVIHSDGSIETIPTPK
ncbi:MAG TPA: hypothetical protein VMB73_06515 [Acetobacteraceae bacterium]|jgi:hypothetical protein|nr:hypothetical protein [Acetobacteraceae bacterium]